MSIYSMVELSNSKIAVACYENIFVWDIVNQKQLARYSNSEDSIKKLIVLQPSASNLDTTQQVESDCFCSIDITGLLNFYDGEVLEQQMNQGNAPGNLNQFQAPAPGSMSKMTVSAVQEADMGDNALQGSRSAMLNFGLGTAGVEIKDLIQVAPDKIVVCLENAFKLIQISYTEQIRQVHL
mmetsp:Transcript_3753/g.2793  ORF Transcript_3753/g.2793 Transcript_3753/m.2793 type:complete len:181 (+) Transcript_3753:82-624(+)